MLYINKRVHKETAENYGNHEYGMADVNVVTGCRGVYNMGRNITFKVVVPIDL